uniref:Caffeic acid O-methyltransferase n=1 Tax=Cunninghamia lanceolata TaxID=28977 RepID=K7YN82_CUNLA|nr:caffeic acid O-methyltransferase [Cunninghamia lanceolata]QBC40976.1 caffeic acid O-methyltransferase [Cunninghamia lanceolata]
MGSVDAAIINEEEWLVGMELGTFSCLPMAIKAAIELDVLQIIANAGHGIQVSPTQIVSQIPNVTNPDAAITLDRILRVLASHSLLSCSVTTDKNGKPERLYGLTPLCKYLVQNKDGLSLAPLSLMNQDKVFIDTWFYLKDAVLEGSQPFTKAHGVNAFEYPAKDQRFNRVFNKAMSEHSTLVMGRVLETYQGFKDLEELVDVGGGIGSTLNLIVSKYPHIKGVNFDMPHVVADAPEFPGVTHVGGDMFDSVPSGKAIFMKWILHDWSDDHCIKLLKNCHKALPEKGKVIAVDSILPVAAETSAYARQAFHVDLCMLAYNPGGKERTEEEFKDLAKATGFAGGVKPICCVNGVWVIEFHK